MRVTADGRSRPRAAWDWLGRALLRTAFLLVGAAISFGFALLDIGLVVTVWDAWPGPVSAVALAVAVTAPPVLVATLPGVRELEVVASRSLLRVTGDLYEAPARTWVNTRRTTGFVLAHLVLGGLAGGLVAVAVPSIVRAAHTAFITADGSPVSSWFTRPGGLMGDAAILALAAVSVAVALAAVAAAGQVMAHLSPRLLGPTDADRLAVARARLRREAEHRRLARDLHDGIGHALSVISLQAAAGRRLIDRDRDRAAEVLATVETTARRASAELDHMLGLLRDDASPSSPQPDRRLDDLGALIDTYRAAGMSIHADLADPSAVPPLISREAYRIAQEGLTNAQRHGGTSAELTTLVDAGVLVIDLRNPTTTAATARERQRTSGGRGLYGLRERVGMFGGDLEVGPVSTTTWGLRAELPIGSPP